ncbi:MAG: DNA alkylation repair protein [Planctomycetota bacterium]
MPPSEPSDRRKKAPAKKKTKQTAKKPAKKAAAKTTTTNSTKQTTKKLKTAAPDARAAHRWTLDEVIEQLEQLGTDQNRKVYPRHGVNPDRLYGVSFASYYALAKRIRPGTGAAHKLAFELWATENHDARMLACMIADPAGFDPIELDRWVKDADNYIIADAIAALVTRTPQAESRVTRWIKAGHEYTQRCGYMILAGLIKQADDPASAKSLPRKAANYDAEALAEFLNTIETNIHDAPNRAAEAMNTCLIAIGTYRDELRDDAVAAAQRIGDINIDHGDTNCKTPDAAAYIAKAAAHRKKVKSNKKS